MGDFFGDEMRVFGHKMPFFGKNGVKSSFLHGEVLTQNGGFCEV